MKRFLIFAGDDYEAAGGWDDLIDSFDVLDLAIQHARRSMYQHKRGGNDWAHIVDARHGKVCHRIERYNGKIRDRAVSE